LAELARNLHVALIQSRTGIDPEANWVVFETAARAARTAGATLIATAEGSNFLQREPAAFQALVRPEATDVFARRAGTLAAELGAALLLGSVLVRREDGSAANRSLLVGPDGALIARYDKIHLFDVALGPGAEHRESAVYTPGAAACVADVVGASLGLTICYDMRFPHLYRDLAKAGAEVIAAPAAFTVTTGMAHWEVLLRARAIETGAYVIAPAQGGVHADGRATWGRSMVIDPWGAIVAAAPDDEPAIVHATLDLARVAACRRKIPALTHDRPYAAVGTPA
jgi:deaminated glutathione amidase